MVQAKAVEEVFLLPECTALAEPLGDGAAMREQARAAKPMPAALTRCLIGQVPCVTSCDMQPKPHRPSKPQLRIRIVFGEDEMIGPGKADLLERIDRCGSIAAAGREMSMSYKRAWELIGTLNAMFRAPLVERTRGGPGGGGAVLSELGREVLSLYRTFEADAAKGGAAQLAALQSRLRDIPEEK